MKPPEQAEDQPSTEDESTSLAKLLLKKICLFIGLSLGIGLILLIMLIAIPFPLNYLMFYCSAILYGVIIIIVAGPVFRHIDQLYLRIEKNISRKDPGIIGTEAVNFLDLLTLRFLGRNIGVWALRIFGVIITGVCAYQLYSLLT